MKPTAILAGLLLGYAASLLAAPRHLPYRLPLPSPQAAAGFTADKGKFRIMQQGAKLGSEDFDLARAAGGWVAHGDALPTARPRIMTGRRRRRKKSSGSVAFENGTAKSSITLEGKDAVRQDFKFTSPRIAVLDNNLFDQYVIFDWNAKGTQTFPVVIPQDMTPGSITVESLGPTQSGPARR